MRTCKVSDHFYRRDSEPSKPPREAPERPTAHSGLQLIFQTSRDEASVWSVDITELASIPEHRLNLTLLLNEIYRYLFSQWWWKCSTENRSQLAPSVWRTLAAAGCSSAAPDQGRLGFGFVFREWDHEPSSWPEQHRSRIQARTWKQLAQNIRVILWNSNNISNWQFQRYRIEMKDGAVLTGWFQEGSRMVPDGAGWFQDGSRILPDASVMTQPSFTQTTETWRNACHFFSKVRKSLKNGEMRWKEEIRQQEGSPTGEREDRRRSGWLKRGWQKKERRVGG